MLLKPIPFRLAPLIIEPFVIAPDIGELIDVVRGDKRSVDVLQRIEVRALACDLRIVAREDKLALNFTRLGLHPGMGATWTLPRLVGPARAAELLYTGEPFDGGEAERMGLANRAVSQADVLPRARKLAQAVAQAAPGAIRGVKRSLRRTAEVSLEDQLGFEAACQAEDFGTADAREGIAAAREGRAPRFTGQ